TANLLRGLRQRIERRIERIDLLELEQRGVRHAARVVDLAALEQAQEDVQRWRPLAGAHRRTRLGQSLGDGETVPPIVGDPCNQCSLASEIDAQHCLSFTKWERGAGSGTLR